MRFPPRPTGAARLVPGPVAHRLGWKTASPWLFWLLWGGWLAVSDLRSDQLQPTVLRLLIGSAALGSMRPARWWLWSLALAVWVPAEPMLAGLLRITPDFEAGPGLWLLPPLPALAGGFLGRSLTRGLAAPRTR